MFSFHQRSKPQLHFISIYYIHQPSLLHLNNNSLILARFKLTIFRSLAQISSPELTDKCLNSWVYRFDTALIFTRIKQTFSVLLYKRKTGEGLHTSTVCDVTWCHVFWGPIMIWHLESSSHSTCSMTWTHFQFTYSCIFILFVDRELVEEKGVVYLVTVTRCLMLPVDPPFINRSERRGQIKS